MCAFPDSSLADDMAERALSRTGQIIDKHGPRLAGSQACLDAAATIRADFAKFCDEVHTEDFVAHPGAFLGFIKILVSGYVAGVVLLWVNLPLFAWCAQFAAVIITLFEYILYWHFVDWLYPAVTGRNVWGAIEPTGAVQRVVLLSGHHDSAQRFNFYEGGGPYQQREKRAFGLFFLMLAMITGIVVARYRSGELCEPGFARGAALYVAAVFTLCFYFVRPLWGFLNDEGCPRAGDNLVSTMMFAEVGNYFGEHRLEHTRVIVLSFDAEECGLRGSRAFWQQHMHEFRRTPTFLLNSDCPYYQDELKFLTRDINLTVGLDTELAQECADVAASLGFSAKICPIAFFAGATDAGEAARAGIRCTSMLSLPFTNAARPTVYHTIDDVVSSIEPKAIAQAIAVALRWTQGIDQGIYGK
jgi:hypothetical protein